MYSAFFFRFAYVHTKKKLYNLKNEGVTNKLSPHEISFCSFGSGGSESGGASDVRRKIKKNCFEWKPKFSRFLTTKFTWFSESGRTRNSHGMKILTALLRRQKKSRFPTSPTKFSNFLLWPLSFQLTPPLITYFHVWFIGILSASSFASLCVLSSGRENNQAWVVKPPTTEY